MVTGDTILLVIVYTQPFIMGLLVLIASRPRLSVFYWTTRNVSTRHHAKGTRFFECAAYPRLTGWLRYGTQGLALCAVFLLYDLDLVFFFSEVTNFET